MSARQRLVATAIALGAIEVVVSACDSSEDHPAPPSIDGGGDAAATDTAPSPDAAAETSADAPAVDASPSPIVCTVAPCAVAIAAGAQSACVLLKTGAVQCWGSNEQGELGRGDGTMGLSGAPGPVADLSDAIQIAGAASDLGDFYCALRTGGTVVCWGTNIRGTLGRTTETGASTEPSAVAAAVSGLGTAKAIFAGATVACAVLDGDEIACWGTNSAAQIPSLPTEQWPPVASTTFALATATVSLGIADRGTVALTPGAELISWGVRGDLLGEGTGVLGREVSTDRAPPAKIALGGISAVAASAGHACAIASGRVHCWGAAYGTEGDSVYPAPSGVGDPSLPAQTIAVGPRSACATLSNGTARCWGDNSRGQLGAGTITLEPLPVMVKNLAGQPVRMAAMRRATCAILASGAVQCWGQNDRGQLGSGVVDALAHLEPQNVVLSP